MGIRFLCPNGHKLNVKSFQAGKRGVCPRCGVVVKIPTESTRRSTARKEGNPEAPAEPPPTDGVDPLAEHTHAVWYVRPASGGQFGPADADTMRSWIAEGRVGADSLVWQEGWRDWREGSAMFPQIEAEEETSAIGEGIRATGPVRGGVSGGRRTPSGSRPWVWVLLGVVVVIVLSLVLLYVLNPSLFSRKPEGPRGEVSVVEPGVPWPSGRPPL